LVIVVETLDEAIKLSNLIAPEHLELAVENPKELLPKITNAGAVFLGRHTPEAIGDYMAGPSHVLPTASSARFSSGLSVTDFMKRQSVIGCDAKSFKEISAATALLANVEGLGAHALSITIRQDK
jgi:histidinol dehydrogenase